MEQSTYQADAIVVGAGIAGIITALELLDQGKRVLLVDRDDEQGFGGQAKWAFGGMFFVDSPVQRRVGISDSIQLARQDWWSYAQFDDTDPWGPRWAEQFLQLITPHGYHWLHEHGIRFFPILNWAERGDQPPGNSLPRFHLLWGTGLELVRVFGGKLRNHPQRDRLQLLFGHRVQEIVQQNGAITGIAGTLEADGSEFTANAEAVVVATGGIGGSIQRVKENWHTDWHTPPEKILNGSHPFVIGDLHDATQRAGGAVANLDKQWNYAAGVHHPQPQWPDHGLSLVPCKSALWMNYRGERLGPTPLVSTYDTRQFIERICQQQKKYSWQILNMNIANKEFAISGAEHNTTVRDKSLVGFIKGVLLGNKRLVQEMIDTCPDFVVADSIDELAEKMNAVTGDGDVDIHLLRSSIEQYDAHIDRGQRFFNDEQLRRIAHIRQYRVERLRTCKFQKIDDPKARPLIAIREFILSRKSLGGIQTDLESRVLSSPNPTDGHQQPIPGLWAVGEAAGFGGGGMHGLRALEGTFLSGCVITARVAAKSIAGQKLHV